MGARLGSKQVLAALAASEDVHYSACGLARRIAISRRHLQRLFRQPYQSALSAWLREQRSLDAKAALTAGAQLKAVAGKLYYKHQSSFTRAFAHNNHVGPRDYQRDQAARGKTANPANNHSTMSQNAKNVPKC